MAKKKAAKKTVRKAAKKPARKATKTKSAPKKQPTVVTVTPPMVDVTANVNDSVVPVSKHTTVEAPTSTLKPHESAAKHEAFTQSLTEEPPKRGFWARLFGRK